MEKSVYRWDLPDPATKEFTLPLPEGAEVVRFDWQERHRGIYNQAGTTKSWTPATETYSLWAVITIGAGFKLRTFIVIGTGWDLPEGAEWKYVASTKAPNNFHMWHLFEKQEGA